MATVVLRMRAGKWKYSVGRIKSVHILHEVGEHHLISLHYVELKMHIVKLEQTLNIKIKKYA